MKKLVFLGLLFLNCQSYSLFAQCGSANNIIQNLSNNYQITMSSGLYQAGQSFIATCTGNIESITLTITNVSGDGDHKIRIYDGTDASNPIDSTIFTVTTAQIQSDLQILFPVPVPVISGNSYTFMMQYLSAAAVSYGVNNSDVYSGGDLRTHVIGNIDFNPLNSFADFKFIIHYQDEILPIPVCQDGTVELDQAGNVVFSPSLVGSGSSDDSGIFSLSMDTTYSCGDIGVNPVILTVNDPSGNSATCNATITVVDLLAPEITCPGNIDTTLAAGETYSLPDFLSTGIVSITDNCSTTLSNTSQNPIAGTQLSLGVNTISITSEDEYGNQGTCSFEINVGSLTLEDLQLLGIEIYPNPVTDWVTIKNSKGLSLEQASIFDLRGNLIFTTKLNESIKEQQLDLSQLNAGLYLVKIQSVDRQFMQQLIIKD